MYITVISFWHLFHITILFTLLIFYITILSILLILISVMYKLNVHISCHEDDTHIR